MVLAELRDPKAREHWERLGLSGVEVKVENPTSDSMAQVIAFAKKTGDFAVLSKTDLSVVALTYQYEVEVNGLINIRTELGQKRSPLGQTSEEGMQEGQADLNGQEALDEDPEDRSGEDGTSDDHEAGSEEIHFNEISESIEQVMLGDNESRGESSTAGGITEPGETMASILQSSSANDETDIQPPADECDGEGDWITPSNVSTHRSHDLGLVPDDASSSTNVDVTPLGAACMTGDFAVQNVLLGMGLGLVGEGGKRISKVRSWVLRCHACFK